MLFERNDPILIIGGGVIGLSLAWELARRSQPVILLDSGSSGHPPTSWAGAGILPPSPIKGCVDPLEQLKALSRELHEKWAKRLLEDTGIDTGFRKCGGIYLASSPAEAATLTANQKLWDLHGIRYEKLSKQQLVQFEPNLAAFAQNHYLGAWYLPEEYQIRNPWHLRALRAALSRLGMKPVDDTVTDIRLDCSGQTTVLTEKGETYKGYRVCLCSGAWTRNFLEQIGIKTGIMPIRGQMVLYRSPQPLVTRIINEGNRYLVPREDGHLLAGSVEEEVGFDCRTTDQAINYIRNWAESVLPILNQTKIEKTWAGLRPGSFDGLPYLGAVPGSNSLFVAAGHFRSGLQLSGATAVVMANLLLGQPNEIDLTPFRIGR